MELTTTKKRKVIDLDLETFRRLSIMAANKGTNLKNFIETSLKAIAEDYEDSIVYMWHTKNNKEMHEIVSEEEAREFEKNFDLRTDV